MDLVVAELWRQQREHNEHQRQRQRLLKLERSNHPRVGRQGNTSHHGEHQTDGSSHRGEAKTHGLRHDVSRLFSQHKEQRASRGSAEAEVLTKGEAGETLLASSWNFCLQLAADVLEHRFCEEWQLRRETEPLADLGFLLLALEPAASRSARDESTND